ncbi:MAG: YihY/virulence factor BrkB family protein [Chloroflexi bacterium]|nr:YihY/virulence factor BrkB family protein [Chloroflexota bacterium]
MVEFAKTFVAKIERDDVLGVAAELAFRFMFAMFPLLMFVAALSSYVAGWLGIDDPTQEILREAGRHLPADAASLVQGQLEGIFTSRNPGLLTISLLAALWAASSGTKTVMKSLNRIYEVDEARPFIRKQVTGVLLTLLGGLAFLVGAIVLMTGQIVGEEMAGWFGMAETWGLFVTMARIPLVLLILVVTVSLIYWSAPNARKPFHLLSWGALFFVISWLLATLGFGAYVSNFASYNATYGSLGSVIVLMTWLYLSALLLLLGAEVNVVLASHLDPDDRGTEGPAVST